MKLIASIETFSKYGIQIFWGSSEQGVDSSAACFQASINAWWEIYIYQSSSWSIFTHLAMEMDMFEKFEHIVAILFA